MNSKAKNYKKDVIIEPKIKVDLEKNVQEIVMLQTPKGKGVHHKNKIRTTTFQTTNKKHMKEREAIIRLRKVKEVINLCIRGGGILRKDEDFGLGKCKIGRIRKYSRIQRYSI